MRTKLFALALASCLELVMVSSSVQAQLFAGFRGRRWDVSVGGPVYYDGYYGYRNGYFGPWVPLGGTYYTDGGNWYSNSYVYPRYEYATVWPYSNVVTPAANPQVVDSAVTVAPISTTDAAAPATPGSVVSQSFYSGPPSVIDRMDFRVMLPADDAKLYFNDRLIEQSGQERKLSTASAAAGQYPYRVRATWMENGQEKSEMHSVLLRPGQMATIQFGPQKERKQ